MTVDREILRLKNELSRMELELDSRPAKLRVLPRTSGTIGRDIENRELQLLKEADGTASLVLRIDNELYEVALTKKV